MRRLEHRISQVIRPPGALARLDLVAVWLAGWQRRDTPQVDRPLLAVFVADHGVAAAAPVSAYPPEVTAAMLAQLRSGRATASVMAAALGVATQVVDVGVGRPTGDIRVEAGLGADDFARCWREGAAVVAGADTDLLVLGEMGIGNTTAAAAVSLALHGGDAEDWTGRGTGIDGSRLRRKLAAVSAAAARVSSEEPWEILRQVGGAEMVAIAAAIHEARLRSIPVLLDGYVVTAAAAVLEAAIPGSLDHAQAGHCSAEPGHRNLLRLLGKEPLLDLGLRLGEGTGALAALPLVRLAAVTATSVATFEEAGVPTR